MREPLFTSEQEQLAARMKVPKREAWDLPWIEKHPQRRVTSTAREASVAPEKRGKPAGAGKLPHSLIVLRR